ncbi:hypothetical protein SUGI_0378320 [Cryptomeria japonica]|nr:hypothetical protein SUGI_0378320 [Cryptomeria japonica]
MQKIDGFVRVVDGPALANVVLDLDNDCWVSILVTCFNFANYISSESKVESNESESKDKEKIQRRSAKEKKKNFIMEAWEVFRVGVKNRNLDPFEGCSIRMITGSLHLSLSM